MRALAPVIIGVALCEDAGLALALDGLDAGGQAPPGLVRRGGVLVVEGVCVCDCVCNCA